jgi:hypothetical protein
MYVCRERERERCEIEKDEIRKKEMGTGENRCEIRMQRET